MKATTSTERLPGTTTSTQHRAPTWYDHEHPAPSGYLVHAPSGYLVHAPSAYLVALRRSSHAPSSARSTSKPSCSSTAALASSTKRLSTPLFQQVCALPVGQCRVVLASSSSIRASARMSTTASSCLAVRSFTHSPPRRSYPHIHKPPLRLPPLPPSLFCLSDPGWMLRERERLSGETAPNGERSRFALRVDLSTTLCPSVGRSITSGSFPCRCLVAVSRRVPPHQKLTGPPSPP